MGCLQESCGVVVTSLGDMSEFPTCQYETPEKGVTQSDIKDVESRLNVMTLAARVLYYQCHHNEGEQNNKTSSCAASALNIATAPAPVCSPYKAVSTEIIYYSFDHLASMLAYFPIFLFL